MTGQDWDINDVMIEEIVEHLKDYHQVPFNDRGAMGKEEFISSHFPETVSIYQTKHNGYIDEKNEKLITKVKTKLADAIKKCEENEIPIANVHDFDKELGIPLWRICKPTQEQIDYLKFNRWMKIIEGLANKTLLQGNLIETIELDVVLEEIKNSITEGQTKREEKKIKVAEKKKKKEKEIEN